MVGAPRSGAPAMLHDVWNYLDHRLLAIRQSARKSHDAERPTYVDGEEQPGGRLSAVTCEQAIPAKSGETPWEWGSEL